MILFHSGATCYWVVVVQPGACDIEDVVIIGEVSDAIIALEVMLLVVCWCCCCLGVLLFHAGLVVAAVVIIVGDEGGMSAIVDCWCDSWTGDNGSGSGGGGGAWWGFVKWWGCTVTVAASSSGRNRPPFFRLLNTSVALSKWCRWCFFLLLLLLLPPLPLLLLLLLLLMMFVSPSKLPSWCWLAWRPIHKCNSAASYIIPILSAITNPLFQSC